jgi:hypothetical protein
MSQEGGSDHFKLGRMLHAIESGHVLALEETLNVEN